MATDIPSEGTTYGDDGKNLQVPVVWTVVLLALCCGTVCAVVWFCVRVFCRSPQRVVPNAQTFRAQAKADKEIQDRAKAEAHARHDAAVQAARIRHETACRDIVRGSLAAQGKRYYRQERVATAAHGQPTRQERAVIDDPARDVVVEAAVNLQLLRLQL